MSIGSARQVVGGAFELVGAASQRFECRLSPAMTFGLGWIGYPQPASGNPSIVVVLWGGIGIGGIALMVIVDMLVARVL